MKRFMKLFMLFALVGSSLLISFKGEANAASYSVDDYKDVSKNYVYYPQIMFLKEKGVIKDADYFNPKAKATRAQVVLMVSRALGLDDTPRKTIFKDVQTVNSDSGTIQSAYEKGIVLGYPNGKMGADENVSRGHMSAFVARGFKDTIPVGTVKYTMYKDVKKGTTAYEPVQILASAGIVYGYGDNTFHPDEAISREHVAVILARALGYKENVDTQAQAQAKSEMEIHQIPLSNSKALLFKSSEGNFLINTGLASDNATLVTYLNGVGVKKLDYVILTDEFATSYDGLEALHKKIPVGLVMHGLANADTSFDTAIERMKATYDVDTVLLEKGVFVKTSTTSSTQGFSVVEGLDSIKEKGSLSNNNNRLVLEFKYNDTSMKIGESEYSLLSTKEPIIYLK